MNRERGKLNGNNSTLYHRSFHVGKHEFATVKIKEKHLDGTPGFHT